jgi:HlyD family secretion protein
MSAQPQPRPLLFPRAKPQRPRRSLYAILALGLVVVAAAWVVSSEMRETEVQTVMPVRQDISTTLASSGVVVPVHDYPVRANFAGMIEKIDVKVGQKVRAGQLLVQMKDQYAASRLETARAALEEAEANLQNAQRNGSRDDRIGYAADLARAESDRNAAAAALASLQKLERQGSVSQAEVFNGMRQLKMDQIAVDELQQRMTHRYSAAEIASLKARLREKKDELAAEQVSWANANISAPMSGTIYILPVRQYDFVPSGAELMHVADLSQFEIRLDFYEPDLPRLRTGQAATIQWDGEPGRIWKGTVVSRSMAVDRTGPLNVGHCTVLLTTPIGDLPINSSVTVTIETMKHAGVLTIPHQALHEKGSEKFVYIVAGGKLKKTPVTVGLVNDMTAEITGGLTGRDRVAVRASNGTALSDGRRVRAVNEL